MRIGAYACCLVHLDAGQAVRNLYLAASMVICCAYVTGGFNHHILAYLLEIDGIEEFVIKCATVEKKEKEQISERGLMSKKNSG
ncbi:MAG TPA: hypothetical protein VMW63_00195 [Methanoregulaceae archaeon]|nr:hypothetical protein [Methanoregulaceae archaeon]